MTEINHRRNGKAYSRLNRRYIRFYWTTKPSGLYIGSASSRDYRRRVKALVRRITRRRLNRALQREL